MSRDLCVGKPIKIGLSGKMASGKSTIASYLVETWGFIEYSFAAKLKEIAADLFGCNSKDRQLLQDLGIKMREIRDTVWVDYVLKDLPNDRDVVISDVRFKNEANLLKAKGFILIRLWLPNDAWWKRVQRLYPDMAEPDPYMLRWNQVVNHISETDLDNYIFDYRVSTDQGIYKTVKEVNWLVCAEKGLIDG